MGISRLMIGAAAAAMTLAGVPAAAQDAYSSGYEPGYYPAPDYAPRSEAYAYGQPAYSSDAPPWVDGVVVRPRMSDRLSRTDRFSEELTATRRVSYRDLDLTTTYGVDQLTDRVRQAARSVCNELDSYAEDAGRPCFRSAMDDAMYQVRGAIVAASNERAW